MYVVRRTRSVYHLSIIVHVAVNTTFLLLILDIAVDGRDDVNRNVRPR